MESPPSSAAFSEHSGPAGDPCPLLLTDRELAKRDIASRESEAAEVLAVIGRALDAADTTLSNIESDGTLGPALKRVCNELADTINHVASEIGKQSEEERRRFARACLEDARNELALLESVEALSPASSSESSEDANNDGLPVDHRRAPSAAEKMSSITEEEMAEAVTSAQSILLDVEDVLRSVGDDEAEEIAEVGIAVARMFIWSLQSIQHSVSPQLLAGTEEDRRMAEQRVKGGDDKGLQIELLDDDEESVDGVKNNDLGDAQALPPPPAPTSRDRRMRVLWPPLGPAVASVASWGADRASNKPILSVALGLALWPAAIVAAFIGAPLVAVDHAVQSTYDANKDSSVIEAAERGAANLYQVGKLYYLCSKLVIKQSIRVGGRQIHRRGGLGAVACDVGGFAIDRALHPIETASWAWNGVKWGAGTLLEAAAFVKDVATGEVGYVGGVPADMH
jgi:hypothetical protein